jgi:hypothetical protein
MIQMLHHPAQIEMAACLIETIGLQIQMAAYLVPQIQMAACLVG